MTTLIDIARALQQETARVIAGRNGAEVIRDEEPNPIVLGVPAKSRGLNHQPSGDTAV